MQFKPFGSVKINVQKLGIDLMSMSGHKFYGPKGIGALYVRNGIKIEPLIYGGHQESGKRAGTENVPAIIGMGRAIEIATQNIDSYAERLTYMRDYLIVDIQRNIPLVRLNGHIYKRLPGNINMSFDGINGGTLLLLLAEKGIYCSSASACSTRDSAPSHVLKAIGLPDEIAKGTIRITLGEENTLDDVKYISKNIKEIVKRLREEQKK